jgi:hypothetical protein
MEDGPMKSRTLLVGIMTQTLLLGILLMGSAAAQSSLPNPHDDSCWSSLSALRACQTQAYDQAQAYAQNCTSYPEYQCFDYYQPKNTPKKAAVKTKASTDSAVPVTATGAIVTPDSGTQMSGAN